jgi:hypothetical protein
MLPGLEREVRVEHARPFLETYAAVSSDDAVALTRAAGQYADALWWADADPRIAWIKLVGALETAANSFDASTGSNAVDLLKGHRGKLYGRLKRVSPEAIEIVADELAGLLNAQGKMVSFTLKHAPDPPELRPFIARFNFDDLEKALRMICEWRSRDLHDGIPFPGPMCEPPIVDDEGVAHERMAFIAATSHGGTWEADEQLPMYLHTFAHVVGGALQNWWAGLA